MGKGEEQRPALAFHPSRRQTHRSLLVFGRRGANLTSAAGAKQTEGADGGNRAVMAHASRQKPAQAPVTLELVSTCSQILDVAAIVTSEPSPARQGTNWALRSHHYKRREYSNRVLIAVVAQRLECSSNFSVR